MSAETSDSGGDVIRIPALATNSLRAVFDMFGEDIVAVSAKASSGTTNTTSIDDLEAYGIEVKDENRTNFVLDYEIVNPLDPHNPLDEDAQQTILSAAQKRLDDFDTTAEVDLSVQSLEVTVESEAVMEHSKAQSPRFDLQFNSEPTKERYREKTAEKNDNDLYSDLGFEKHNLNLHTVYERERRYDGSNSDGRIYSWQGYSPDDMKPKAPKRLVRTIKREVLPDEYGILKSLQVSEDRTLEPAGSVDDEEDEEEAEGQEQSN